MREQQSQFIDISPKNNDLIFTNVLLCADRIKVILKQESVFRPSRDYRFSPLSDLGKKF